MISWIQRYFQHHFKVIFGVLLGLIIISFVFTIGAAPGIGQGDRQMVDRHFFGYNLALQADQQKLMGDAGLSWSLRVGPYGNPDGDRLQNYAFQRAAVLHLADAWNIPSPTSAEVETEIKTLRMFAGQDGQFDPKAYQMFRDNLKANPRGINEGDVARVISDDIRGNKVQDLLSGPGYVLPAEIKTQLERADTTWTLAVASADYAAFKPEITPSDTELTQFFEQSGDRYNIPPRVVVSYLDFSARDYLANVTVNDAEVRAFYDANPARFPKPTDTAKPPTSLVPKLTTPDATGDFAAVRPQVETALKQERAAKLAIKAASDFTLALFEAKARSTEAVDAFLASKKLSTKTLPAFSRDNPPAPLASSPDAVAEAFRLSQDRPVSDALATPEGAVVLFWKETLPTVKPQFAQVRDQVASDYKENERRKRFAELGKTVKAQLEARLKAGDTFEKAAEAASNSGLKLETKTLPPFTPRSQPRDVDYSVLGTLERLEKGAVSDMVMSADKGLFVYAIDQKAPDLSETNPQFAQTREQIAGYNGRFAASAYINELIEQEMKRSEPKGQ